MPYPAYIFVLLSTSVLEAQSVVSTQIQVSDAADRPIPHVTLSAKGDSSTSPPTDKAGKTHLLLPGSIAPGEHVSLVLVDAPDSRLRFLSPWEGHATIPRGDAVEVILGTPGDPSVLNNAQVRQSIRGAITAAVAAPGPGPGPGSSGPKGAAPGPTAPPQRPSQDASIRLALAKVSAQIGLRPVDVLQTLQKTANSDAIHARRNSNGGKSSFGNMSSQNNRSEHSHHH